MRLAKQQLCPARAPWTYQQAAAGPGWKAPSWPPDAGVNPCLLSEATEFQPLDGLLWGNIEVIKQETPQGEGRVTLEEFPPDTVEKEEPLAGKRGTEREGGKEKPA